MNVLWCSDDFLGHRMPRQRPFWSRYDFSESLATDDHYRGSTCAHRPIAPGWRRRSVRVATQGWWHPDLTGHHHPAGTVRAVRDTRAPPRLSCSSQRSPRQLTVNRPAADMGPSGIPARYDLPTRISITWTSSVRVPLAIEHAVEMSTEEVVLAGAVATDRHAGVAGRVLVGVAVDSATAGRAEQGRSSGRVPLPLSAVPVDPARRGHSASGSCQLSVTTGAATHRCHSPVARHVRQRRQPPQHGQRRDDDQVLRRP